MEKIEWIVKKNTEIGVKKIVFFRSQFSQKLHISEAKKQRLKKIVIEATEQCGAMVPTEVVFSEKNFAQLVVEAEENFDHLCLHTATNVQKNIPPKKDVTIWVGPE